MLKLILALFLLALPSLAQTGTLSIPAALTSHAVTLDLPPPNAGMTRVAIAVTSTFEQSCTVWSEIPAPFVATAYFCNEVRLNNGPATSERARLPMLCDFGVTVVERATVVNHPPRVLPIGPVTLRANVRARVYAFPDLGGLYTHGTQSFASHEVTFTYLP